MEVKILRNEVSVSNCKKGRKCGLSHSWTFKGREGLRRNEGIRSKEENTLPGSIVVQEVLLWGKKGREQRQPPRDRLQSMFKPSSFLRLKSHILRS